MTEVIQPELDETRAAQSGPAFYTNKFIVTVGPVVRISFMEQFGVGTPAYARTSVTMVHQDAISLAGLLKSLLKDVEAQLAALEPKDGIAPKGGSDGR